MLTGSTNYTENGLFGHLNCAHIVNDANVAQISRLLDRTAKDQALAELRPWNDDKTPAPPDPPDPGTQEVFSPQKGTATLARYGEISEGAQKALFMTFAFGMSKPFVPVYLQEDGVLRFALMDKEGTGKGIEQPGNHREESRS